LGRSIETGLILLAVYAALFVLLAVSRIRVTVLAWGIIALSVLDPAFHNRTVNPTVPASFFDRPPIMDELKPPLTVFRAADYFLDRRERSGSNVRFLAYYRKTLYPLTAMADGVRYVFNADFYGTYPRRQSELERSVKRRPPDDQLKILRYLGCNDFISDYPLFSKEAARRLLVEGFPVYVERITDQPARAYVAVSARRAASPEDALKIFVGPDFDPRAEVVTEKDPGLPGAAGGPDALSGEMPSIRTREEAVGRARYEVDLPREGVAVFPGNFARGWRAWVDGRRAEVFEANLFAKGVRVPAGQHEIVLRYLPASFLLGAAVSLVTVLLLTAGGLAGHARVRRKARRELS
jgi:hypothetical protein